MAYDLNAIRKKINEASSKKSDPLEFKPKKVQDDETMLYRFFILPPLSKGDKCAGGVASRDMEMYTVANGVHWLNNRPYGCPRVLNGEDCPICKHGFDLLNKIPKDDAPTRDKVKREFMAASYHMVNIYFTDSKSNPEELRGQVRYFAAPHTCFKLWNDAIGRDDGGDPVDPRAYGVFFDENSSFLFQLEVTKNGQNNSYAKSKFIVQNMPRPIADSPSDIKDILDRRVDLYTKLHDIDVSALNKILNQMTLGDDGDSGFDEDDTRSSSKPTVTVESAGKGKSSLDAEEAVSSKPKEKPPFQADANEDTDDEVERLMAGMDDE